MSLHRNHLCCVRQVVGSPRESHACNSASRRAKTHTLGTMLLESLCNAACSVHTPCGELASSHEVDLVGC
jgi:hypothetical protein